MNLFGKELNKNNYPLIVAEISCNHSGDLSQAIELIYQAKKAGSDAVKIQIYDADDMSFSAGSHLQKKDFIIQHGPWAGKSLYDLYKKTGTPYEWLPDLFKYARDINIPLFSSVFSERGLAALEKQNCPAYKIASFEIGDTNLISKVVKTSKPVILSTGMATREELERAYMLVNPGNFIFMHCVSAYPTQLAQANLWRIGWLKKFFNCHVGFSDHTMGFRASALACAMGARVIEKHLKLNNDITTEDDKFSMSPPLFKLFVQGCIEAAEAAFKVDVPEEESSRQFKRSLYVVADMQEGDTFSVDNVRSIRPSYGLPSHLFNTVIGKKTKVDIKAGTALKQEHVS